MIPFWRLLKYLPNIAEVPRDTFQAQTNLDAGFMYSTLYNVGRNPFLGLDVTVNNESGSLSTFSLDTRDYWVLDASVRTITNVPYNTFQINTTGATPNRIDTTVFGVSLEWIENQTGKSTYQLAYNNYPDKIVNDEPILDRLHMGDRT
tara:strand:+ start:399 stop:842 length:444 start_codon:yes stop_codon:yes gene_type:complete